MSKKKRKAGGPFDDGPDDIKAFIAELRKESDRGAALVAAQFLSDALEELLRACLIDEKKPVDKLLGTEEMSDRPLSSFSSRIELAYCMGLFGRRVYDDLHAIREIRNHFAHQRRPVSFDALEVHRCCQALHVGEWSGAALEAELSNRDRFLTTVIYLAYGFYLRVQEAEHAKFEPTG
ncbi:MAG: MltR family transcriptional regulator [Armatimonadetes bacterium]|nr:MltR family transcriptional regulator [Armatimonadota bacterium]